MLIRTVGLELDTSAIGERQRRGRRNGHLEDILQRVLAQVEAADRPLEHRTIDRRERHLLRERLALVLPQ